MCVLEPEERPFSEVDHLGLAIRRTAGDGLHTGVLYRIEGESPRILHLAFHHDLRDDPAAQPYRWIQLDMEDVDKVFLAQLAARVVGNPSIAYAFDSDGIAIDPETGDVTAGPPGRGLTCATFVTALLRAHGYELVDLTTWPDREQDPAFHEMIVTELRARGYHEQAEAVAKDTKWRRLRPDELIGAGHFSDENWPVAFASAHEAAVVVQSELG